MRFLWRKYYQESAKWPDDGIEIDDTVFEFMNIGKPEGKYRTVFDGMDKCHGLIFHPSTRGTIQQANWKRQLINQVNEYMNSKQWPGKNAAIGRLKGEELPGAI